MARLPRFVVPCQPQHVIVRGNNRDAIFYAEADYQFYLDKLKQACDKHQCDLHAYVLMTNHVHLLITPHTQDGLSKALQMIGRYYVQYFNFTYTRSGTLFEGRYKATLVDSEHYLLSCYRYIELNPVRAAMVTRPREYPWSSYAVNALGAADARELLTPHKEYLLLDADVTKRRRAYRALFKTRLNETTLEEIRESTNKSWVLGRDKFKAQMEKKTGRPSKPRPRGGDRKSEKFKTNGV